MISDPAEQRIARAGKHAGDAVEHRQAQSLDNLPRQPRGFEAADEIGKPCR